MDRIENAFHEVPRHEFLPTVVKPMAKLDNALSIGYGQTNSQPYTVKLMLKWLEPKPGEKIMDVGSGSGWTTALLSHLVGPKGKIYAVEKVPELVEFGRKNCARLEIKNAEFFKSGLTFGLPKYAPFDRILVSASAQKLPNELIDQLQTGGKMVIPIRNDILEITKTGKDHYEAITHSGFVFVPLV